ncbi:MAG: amino acid adenylation domain-containing protein [Lachnospiraceae bacterium]|nr:amino acid adenylation domain-containing protein [Lachnospiraceae bacterium]
MELLYSDNTLNITLDERLDSDNAPECEKSIFDYLERSENVKKTGIDAKNLKYISSAGIRVLLKLKKRINDMRIINVSDDIYETISITGMEDMFGLEKARMKPVIKADDEADMAPRRSVWHQAVPDKPLSGINDTHVDFEFRPVTCQFEDAASKDPKRLAVVSTAGSYTYGELSKKTDRIANALIYMGIGSGKRVLIMLERGIEIYAATLGVLKAGAAYTIVNVKYPDERIAYICADANCSCVISTRAIVYDRLELFVDELQKRPLFFEDLENHQDCSSPDVSILPEDLCYMIYTSGSTGKPKGVMISHANLSNFLLNDPKNREFMGMAERSTCCLAMAQMTFDVSVMEEYIPLVTGKTVAYALYDEISNPDRMADLMINNNVDGACFTPSYVTGLLKLPKGADAVSRLKVIDFGAEAFPAVLFDKIRSINEEVLLMNGYGPTEATISCTMKIMDDADDITIGTPNANVYVYVIDENNNEVAKTEVGELLICGDGVGDGYINLPEKTAESFISFNGMRGYKSGDLVRINENDEIEYLGRKDHQVKIRGLRIELEEVESVIGSMPGIDSCACASIRGKYLCAYYTSDGEIATEKIREYAASHLAHYMIPDIFMPIAKMPTTPNHKIDRRALPEPEIPDEEVKEPVTDEQREVLSILKEVMDEGTFGINTDLTKIGMSSLDSMVFISLMGERFNIGMSLSDLNDHKTVEELAGYAASAPKLQKSIEKDRYHATMLQAIDYGATITGEGNLNITTLYELDRNIDDDMLKEAIYETMTAHPGLTMSLVTDKDGTLWQVPGGDVRSYEIDITQMDDEEFDAGVSDLSVRIPSDAKNLFCFRIINTQTRKFLFTDYSHLNSDGVSVGIVIEDIIAAYEKKSLEPEYYTMFEFGEFMSGFWESKAGKRCIEMYMTMLESAGGPVTLPFDKNEEKWEPGRISVTLDVDMNAFENKCQKDRITKSEIIACAFGIVLAKYTGRDEVAFSYGFSGRSDSRLNNTVGYISSLLEVCCWTPNCAPDYLEKFKKNLLNLMMFPSMPLVEVLDRYPNAIDITYLYQPKETVLYEMDNTPVRVRSLEKLMPNEEVRFIFQPKEKPDGSIMIDIDYHANLYSEDYVRRFAGEVVQVAGEIISGKI